MNVLHVVGARPNFMKAAPVLRALSERGAACALVHTGQHYDRALSEAFFDDLGMPEPDEHLGVGSGSHAEQTARVMERIEPVLLARAPDLVVVAGDVNSTLGAALAAAKAGFAVAHVEAGLRSFDWTMPEELNRVLTDRVCDLLFTTSEEAEGNLVAEGCARDRVRFVGNPMIDSLERALPLARESKILATLGLAAGEYGVATLHRPANVDEPAGLRALLQGLRDAADEVPLVFPAHPRTAAAIERAGIAVAGAVTLLEPLGYLDFLALIADARLVLTDSGGVQEETTVLGVPCLTVRDNTERPVTIGMGTNRLIGTDPAAIAPAVRETLAAPAPGERRPPLWDGRAGERIAEEILAWGAARR